MGVHSTELVRIVRPIYYFLGVRRAPHFRQENY